ncbi:MAG TPA: energy-coupling factor ABC transporter ATP-binding protein, partial [Acholeplasma sp.]|nr:energy-coupling factor ABC transporter ATP-binding protein [Acholeplasma sp.]
ITNLIRKVNKEMNKTVITITHDLALANKSNHIFVLKDGELILEGSPKEVFKEEELLKSSHLEIPLTLSVYNEISKDKDVDKKLVEALWEFNLNQ